MTTLPPLATTSDIVARLGRPLTDVEAEKAEANLRDASAQVRRYCTKYSMDYLPGDVRTVYVSDGELTLPGMPVYVVTSVIAKGDTANGLPDIPVPWFRFDGIQKVFLDPDAHWIINLPEIWWESGHLYTTFQVIYDHGLMDVPDDAVMVVANAAIGVMSAPSQAAGMIGETMGPYSWRAERGGAGLTVALTQADLAALSVYRQKQGTFRIPGRRTTY